MSLVNTALYKLDDYPPRMYGDEPGDLFEEVADAVSAPYTRG